VPPPLSSPRRRGPIRRSRIEKPGSMGPGSRFARPGRQKVFFRRRSPVVPAKAGTHTPQQKCEAAQYEPWMPLSLSSARASRRPVGSPRAAACLADQMAQILPFQIVFFDQTYLPVAIPFFSAASLGGSHLLRSHRVRHKPAYEPYTSLQIPTLAPTGAVRSEHASHSSRQCTTSRAAGWQAYRRSTRAHSAVVPAKWGPSPQSLTSAAEYGSRVSP
jgi:hypothetical protein